MSEQPRSSARVYLHTLGCPKNEADSRSLRRSLAIAGVALVDDPERATHILVNTCGFIQDAKEESIGAILDATGSYPDKSVLVVGCLVERYREELRAGIPEVAGWFGLVGGADQPELLRVLGADTIRAVGPAVAISADSPPGSSGSGTSYAYVKISDGCDEPCTFCAIPGIKGPYHSHSPEEIRSEALACLDEGCRELVLVGQDTSLWAGDGLDLAGLVDLLAADERVARVRVMYLQPEHLPESFLHYMAGRSKLCRYLDIPFQHSHPDVLRAMGRSGDGEAHLALLDGARRLMPDVSVRSAFIVGFPGETEEHFEHLLSFVEDAQFDYAGGFVYSPEEGTAAAKLKPRVRKAVARDRLNRLNAVLVRCTEQKHQTLVGSRLGVMLDSLSPDETGDGVTAVGRTEGQAPEVDGVTYVEGVLPDGAGVGDVVQVTISAAAGFDLIGTCDET